MRIRLLVLALVVVALPRAALAVCLLGDYSVKAEYDRSVAVVTGQVITERSVPESLEYYAGTMYTVMIDESYRGQLSGSVDVFDENSGGRFPLQVGSRYLLFIDRELGQFVVDNCGNSGLVSDKTEVLQTVRRLRSADSGPPGQTQGDRLVQQLRGLPTPLPPAPRSNDTIRETDQRRADVMRQLRQLGDEALPALARGLSDPDVSIRRNVVIVLISLGMGLGGPKVDIQTVCQHSLQHCKTVTGT